MVQLFPTVDDVLPSGIKLTEVVSDDADSTTIFRCKDGSYVKFFNYDSEDKYHEDGDFECLFDREMRIYEKLGAVMRAESAGAKSQDWVWENRDLKISARNEIAGWKPVPADTPLKAQIPRVLELGQIGGMKYMRLENCGMEPSEEDLCDVEIVRRIVKAIRSVHNCGVVHCDIKPENIVIDNSGKDVRVIDFDCAYCVDAECDWDSIGTYPFCAPEFCGNHEKRKLQYCVDYFALGMTLLEGAGEPAFNKHFAVNGDKKNKHILLRRKLTTENINKYIYRQVKPQLRGLCKSLLSISPERRTMPEL